ncbi:MAG TPA: aminoglycoside phosphotransferase family protein [Caulobacteraceae bacterium]|nr:aminoglycoside phosphotransferase family protein [Caulobacteraceae bacterium]
MAANWSESLFEPVRRRLVSLGVEGAVWLEALDDNVAALADAWELRLERPLAGGSEALILAATTAEGRAVVLKVGFPGSNAGAAEARVLAAAAGRGYAELLHFDEGRRAMLIERLGPSLETFGLPVEAQITALATTLRAAWMPPPAGADFMTGAEKAESLVTFIDETWRTLGRPCSARAVETALRYAQTRGSAFDPKVAVLGHGDPHAANALLAPGEPHRFKFVDPDGLFIEPAYDLGVVMRGWNADLAGPDAVSIARDRSRRLAALTGVDEQAIWEWSVIERMASGLLTRSLGGSWGQPAAEYLAAADALARGD